MKKILCSMFLLMVRVHAGMQSMQQSLLRNEYNPYVTVYIQNEHDNYVRKLSYEISTAIPKFPEVVKDIVTSYINRDTRREELYSAIKTALKYRKAEQWIAGIALLGCATEAVLGVTAIATNQGQLVPHSNIENASILKATGLVATVSLSGLLPVGQFMKCMSEASDIFPNEIDEGWQVIWPSCSALSLGIFTVSLAALVGGSGSVEGSTVAMLFGGLAGTTNATWLLVKSCLRSRELSRRCED